MDNKKNTGTGEISASDIDNIIRKKQQQEDDREPNTGYIILQKLQKSALKPYLRLKLHMQPMEADMVATKIIMHGGISKANLKHVIKQFFSWKTLGTEILRRLESHWRKHTRIMTSIMLFEEWWMKHQKPEKVKCMKEYKKFIRAQRKVSTRFKSSITEVERKEIAMR